MGGVIILLGFILALPLCVSLIYGEWYSAGGFLLSIIIILITGFALYRLFFPDAPEPQNKHALIIVAASWLAISVMGALPFLIIANITPAEVMRHFIPAGADYGTSLLHFRNPLHALFESMSAFTTTGLTMAVHEPSVGKGILFYRSLGQWIGGAGFIVIAIVALNFPGGKTTLLLYDSESSGTKFMTSVYSTAKTVWKLYLGITGIVILYLILGTRIVLPDYPLANNIFDAINHAMTGQSTGGFSTLDNSIAGYNSKKMEILYLLPMILGALSIPFYYKIIRLKKISELWKDIQTRALFVFFIIGGLLVSLLLMNEGISQDPFREGWFQFISALSTTGWQTADIIPWNAAALLLIISAMYIGGAAGATVGGIKISRTLLIIKGIRWQVSSKFFPDKAVKTIKFNRENLLPETMYKRFSEASALALMYIGMIFVSAVVAFLLYKGDHTFAEVLFESASAQGTVGLSSGITGPSMPPLLEVIYIFQMWAGRLELIPVFVLIRTLIWGSSPRVI